LEYFVLTNVTTWQLYRVKKQSKTPDAYLVHEVSLTASSSQDKLVDDFYLFHKACYLDDAWKDVSKQAEATETSDLVAVLLSDRVVKYIGKELANWADSDIKIDEEKLREIIEKQIIKTKIETVDYKLIKKVNDNAVTPKKKQAPESPIAEVKLENGVLPSEAADTSTLPKAA
jgi:hypothetical protein